MGFKTGSLSLIADAFHYLNVRYAPPCLRGLGTNHAAAIHRTSLPSQYLDSSTVAYFAGSSLTYFNTSALSYTAARVRRSIVAEFRKYHRRRRLILTDMHHRTTFPAPRNGEAYPHFQLRPSSSRASRLVFLILPGECPAFADYVMSRRLL